MSTQEIICDALRTIVYMAENPPPPHFIRMVKNILKIVCEE